jgi:phosphohistidine phosphatase SixA
VARADDRQHPALEPARLDEGDSMKHLWLMRHAHPVNGHPMDGTRALDQKGIDQANQMGDWFRDLIGRVDIVICSPFARGLETATIMAEKLGSHVASTRLLEPDALPPESWKEVERLAQQSSDVLIVGHDPNINSLLMWLLGLAGGVPEVRFEHGSIAHLSMKESPATLKWLVDPKLVLKEEYGQLEEAALALMDALSI